MRGREGKRRAAAAADSCAAAVRTAVGRGAGHIGADHLCRQRMVDHRLRVGRRTAGLRAVPGQKTEETGEIPGESSGKEAEARGDIIQSMVKITKIYF